MVSDDFVYLLYGLNVNIPVASVRARSDVDGKCTKVFGKGFAWGDGHVILLFHRQPREATPLASWPSSRRTFLTVDRKSGTHRPKSRESLAAELP